MARFLLGALLTLATVACTGATAGASGGVAGRGDSVAAALVLNAPVVGIASSPDGHGYWMAASDGGVFAYGDARFFGSAGALHLNSPVVGVAATRDGNGYWLAASDGGVFAYGDAQFYGSTGGLRLNAPVVGLASTPDGGGYWLVASDGGIFAFGDAAFFGSAGAMHLNAPVVGMAATPDGGGYWLTATDGGVFTYGDAKFFGSAGAMHLNAPVVGMAATPGGGGYWLTATDGGVFTYGDADFYGSPAGDPAPPHVVAMAATPDGEGCWLATPEGAVLTYGDAGFFGAVPKTVALYGDSLSMEAAPFFDYLGRSAGRSVLLRAHGGLAVCDDLPSMASDAANRHPTVAVMEFSGNAMTPCMSGYSPGTTPYFQKYQADARAAVALFTQQGVPVILIGAPVSAWPDANANIYFLNQIYQSLAATTPGVTYVDAGQAVLSNGAYTRTLPCLTFEPCTGPAGTDIVRSPDGVHFCPDGNTSLQGNYALCDVYSSGAFRFAMALLGPALAY